MRVIVRTAIVVATALVLAGCGGSGSTPQTLSPKTPQDAKDVSVAFRIVIPTPAPNVSTRRPAYISTSTKSATVTVAPSGGSASTPAMVNCTTVCSGTVSAAPGSDTFTVNLYDAPNAGGNLLSSGTLTQTILAGQVNSVNVALNGVPHSIVVEPLTIQTTASSPTAFTLGGIFIAPMQVLARDADANVIIGPGAPTFTIKQSNGSNFAIVNPTVAAPSTFELTAPATNGSVGAFTATASFPDTTCAQSGAVCTLNFNVTAHVQALIVDETSSIAVYAAPYTGSPTKLSGYVGSAGLPGTAAFDASGNLWIGDNQAGNVKEYAPPYTGAPVTSIGTGTFGDVIPVLIAPNGNLFVGSFDNNTVYEYAPPYTGTPTPITSNLSGPDYLAVDPSENLYVANFLSGQVMKYAPPYTGAPVASLPVGSMPIQIAVNAAGDIFAISPGANAINHWAFPYTLESDITTGVSTVEAIAVGPSGALFAAQDGSEIVTIYDAPYTAVSASTTSGVLDAPGLAFDAGGALFVASVGNNSISGFPVPYTGTPLVITNGVASPQGVYLSP
jgi:hypothetical protein